MMSLSTKMAEAQKKYIKNKFLSCVILVESFVYDENLQVSGRMNASDFKTCSDEAWIKK